MRHRDFRSSLCVLVTVTFVYGAVGEYCFEDREPNGRFGRCEGQLGSGMTQAECCTAGGEGWTEKANGKRCEDACAEDAVDVATGEEDPGDGVWGEWTSWSLCDVTCGEGVSTRSRTCGGGDGCDGDSVEEAVCFEGECPVDGEWLPWSDWSDCSVTCGGGIRLKLRECIPPQFGGQECGGRARQEKACGVDPCPVNGNWTEWSDWGRCSQTCADGIMKRRRSCTNPEPAYGGALCDGERRETAVCNDGPCPINGVWSAWSEWSDCPVTCGGSARTRERECNNPPPQHGGEDCEGDARQIWVCGSDPCPVDGNWTKWSDWGRCSVTCDHGTMTRRRSCTNPAPAHGGATCEGDRRQRAACQEGPCPIDGKWGKYEASGECSGTCDSDTDPVYKEERRLCNNPPPQHGGEYCTGAALRRIRCRELPKCAIHGGWTAWTDWSECSQTCDDGEQTKERTCTNPAPQYGGDDCDGKKIKTKICSNPRQCPVHGNWSEWQPWTPCSAPRCGMSGEQMRSRTCDQPSPKRGGRYCQGDVIQRQGCQRLCATWSEWSEWSPCSGGCSGSGFQMRRRKCSGEGRRPSSEPYQERRDCDTCMEDDEDYAMEAEFASGSGEGSGSGSGEGSGSGDGESAREHSVDRTAAEAWNPPCSDEVSCRCGGELPETPECGESSLSYSDIGQVDDKKETFDYSESYDYGDPEADGCPDPEGTGDGPREEPSSVDPDDGAGDGPTEEPPSVDPDVGVVGGGDPPSSSDSYSFEDVLVVGGQAVDQQVNPPAGDVSSDSYSFDLDPGNVIPDADPSSDDMEGGVIFEVSEDPEDGASNSYSNY